MGQFHWMGEIGLHGKFMFGYSHNIGPCLLCYGRDVRYFEGAA